MAVQTLQRSGLSREEKLGLGVAIALHIALVAWLALDRLGKDVGAPPERMTVSFADEIAPEATSPEPLAQAAPDVAPELGEAPSEPQPVATPLPRLAPRAAATPQPKVAAEPPPRETRRRPDTPAGASRIGSDFLKGVAGSEARGSSQNPPSARAGPQVAASLRQAVARQLKPHWVAPQGAEVEFLRTTVSWSLNSDGSIAGTPQLTSQEGVTDANRPQAQRHVEQAIRAIRLAAPFELPKEYYGSWKRLRFTFDRNLSR